MVDLSTFKPFDFNEGVPYFSITNNGVTFNRSVILKLHYPEYVRLLIDEDGQQLALQVCNEKDDKAVRFYKERANGVLSVRWNTRDLINTLARICKWDLKSNAYRVEGVLFPESGIMLFDLKEAKEME